MSHTTPASLLSRTAEDRERLLQTLAYFLAFIALGLGGVILGPTLQRLAEQTNATLSQISFLFAARPLGYMFGSFVSGRLYDRMPGNPVMAVMLLGMTAMLFLMPLMPMLLLLVVVVVILGIVEGAVDVGGNTLLVWTHGRNVAPYMNALHFCWSLGAFLSPLVIAWGITVSNGIALPYSLIAVVMIPPAVLLLARPSPRGHADSAGQPSAPFNVRLGVLIVFFFFLFVGVEATFGGWTATYARALGHSEVTAAYLTSAFWGGLMFGRFISIPIGAVVKPRTVLTVDLLGCIASAALILALPQSTQAMWLGTFGEGVFMAAMFPTTISFAEQRMKITGRMTAWFLVGSSAGGMSIPWLVGQLFEPVGSWVVMVMALGALLAGGLVFAAILSLSGQLEQKTLRVSETSGV